MGECWFNFEFTEKELKHFKDLEKELKQLEFTEKDIQRFKDMEKKKAFNRI